MGTSALQPTRNWSAKPLFTLGMSALLGVIGGGAVAASTFGTPRAKLISSVLDHFNHAFRES